MVDAPERIWACPRGKRCVVSFTSPSDEYNVEYVRADLYEQVKRERDSVQKLADSNYANICTQHRQIEDLTARAEAAERLAGARVVVEPLEWKNNSSNSLWTDELMFGVYYVAYDQGDGWLVERGQFLSEAGPRKIAFGPKVEALAAAQSDFERQILSTLAEPAGEAELWGWVIPKRGRRKPVILEASKHDEVSAAAEAEIDDLGYFPIYTTPPASAIREALEPGDKLAIAVRQYEQECREAGGYMPAIATLLRIYADDMADKYPDDTNLGRRASLAGSAE